VTGAVQNARAFRQLAAAHGSFDAFIWRFVGGRPRTNCFRRMAEIPAETEASRAMSKELKRLGFTFVGPSICYAFMQAVGMVNDHLLACYRHRELA